MIVAIKVSTEDGEGYLVWEHAPAGSFGKPSPGKPSPRFLGKARNLQTSFPGAVCMNEEAPLPLYSGVRWESL